MKKPIDLEKHKAGYLEFVSKRQTVIMSLQNEQGEPFISYAPCVRKDGKIYIYISQIADHYRYVENNELIDVLFIGDEAEAKNMFAMERARFQCTTRNLGNEGYEDIFALFNEAHGKGMLDILRGLDFSLFELTPGQGRYVVGFGMAFDTSFDASEFIHVVVDKKKETVQ